MQPALGFTMALPTNAGKAGEFKRISNSCHKPHQEQKENQKGTSWFLALPQIQV